MITVLVPGLTAIYIVHEILFYIIWHMRNRNWSIWARIPKKALVRSIRVYLGVVQGVGAKMVLPQEAFVKEGLEDAHLTRPSLNRASSFDIHS